MKQKRKETSCLHSSKQCLNAIGTVTLLGVMCGVLGIISVGLLTKSAIAVGGEETTSTVVYTGVDDKVDVVVGLNFIDQDNQSKDLYNFYESGDNLYVTPNNVVVNVTDSLGRIERNNEVIGSVYGHVLGGEGNKLNSDNVTIIAGSSNDLGAGNTNAVLLGGTGNIMGGSEVLALVGGEGNDVNKKDSLIIGGNNNTVNGGNGSTSVLGGKGNVIAGDNAVVGGLGIKMGSDKNNIFAYSNRNVSAGSFTTKSSDAFYLDIQKGLGINLGSTKGGVEMQGAMGFGEIDINQGCNDSSNNYGVQGTWDGCMVGCTKAGGGKWQLLDSSESCKAKCKDDSNGRCVVDVYNPDSVAGRCADATVSAKNATKCGAEQSYKQYKDAIFEVTLVDQGKCPNKKDSLFNNQCVYACNDGYHLVKDETGKIGASDERKGKGCFADCILYNPDGSVAEKVKHNTKTWGYDVNKEYCAYNDGVKTPDPASTYTCKDHKTELMCVDGTFYKKSSGGSWSKTSITWYKSCNLYNYTNCSGSGYKLTKSDITGTYKDSTPSTNTNYDRKSFSLTRGSYYMCINRKAGNTNPVKDGASCTANQQNQFYYKFKECNDDYDYNGTYCEKRCDGEKYDTKKTFYTASSQTCMYECQKVGKQFTCKDGVWRDTSLNAKSSSYKYTICTQKPGNTCEGYNVGSSNREKGKNYDRCVKEYVVNDSCASVTKYKESGCAEGYSGSDCKCGNGVKDDGETCDNCSKDMPAGECDSAPDVPDCEGDDCNEPSPSCEGDDCGGGYVCKGEYPEGVTTGSVAPDNDNTKWKCATDLTDACTYTCPKNYQCNENNNGCEKIEDKSPKCVYGGSKPACEDSEVENPASLTNGECGFKWTCKKGKKSVECSMSYKLETYKNYRYVMKFNGAPNSTIQQKCRNKVPSDVAAMLDLGSMTEGSFQDANEIVRAYGGVIVRNDPERNKWEGDSCDLGDRYCMTCVGYDIETDYESDGVCSIKDGDGTYSDCAGIMSSCTPMPDKDFCGEKRWMLVNTNFHKNCPTETNLRSELTIDEATQLMKGYTWVRSQDFGPNAGGSTYDVWSKGDPCTHGSIYCVPCVAPQCMD